jgi:glycosyltransferase involved in cell wall biosynthesis
VLLVRATGIDPEPRAERTARWLAAAGHEVRILGWARTPAPAEEVRAGVPVRRLRIAARYGAGMRTLVPLVRWQAALLRYLLRHAGEYDCVHACDLDTAGPALAACRLLGKRLVYDIYDFYVESHHVPAPARAAVRRAELAVVSRADAVILVDDSRRAQLAGRAPRRLAVVYNTPEAVAPEAVAPEAVAPEAVAPEAVAPAGAAAPARATGGLRVGFVGLLATNRGLFEMLDVLARRPAWHLDLAGYGEGGAGVVARAGGLPNVTFHGRVDYDRTLALSAGADVLFATYDPRVPNHRYSSANKLFEAMMLGKPIVVARGTGMDRTVEAHGLGAVVPYGDVDALERALAEVAAWDAGRRAAFADHARSVYERHFSAAAMRERLAALYADL